MEINLGKESIKNDIEKVRLQPLDIDWFIRSGKIDKNYEATLKNKQADPKSDEKDKATEPIRTNDHQINKNSSDKDKSNRRQSMNAHEENLNIHKIKSLNADNVEQHKNTVVPDECLPIRRTRSLPSNKEQDDAKSISFTPVDNITTNKSPKPKGSFFKKLFNRQRSSSSASLNSEKVEEQFKKKERRESTSSIGTKPALKELETIRPTDNNNINTSTYNDYNRSSTADSHLNGKNKNKNNVINEVDLRTDNIKLREFLDYYKKNGYNVSSFKNKNGKSIKNIRKKQPCFVIGDPTENRPSSKRNQTTKLEKERVDSRGRSLPDLPEKSKYKSCLKNLTIADSSRGAESPICYSSESESDDESSASPGRFGNFLKKVTSHGTGSRNSRNNSIEYKSIDHNISPDNLMSSNSSIDSKMDFDKFNVPGLEDIKQFKHVAFSPCTYFNDPPQQICSKSPRKGEVEVKEDGTIIIHRLSKEERLKTMENSSLGVVVGGTGYLKLLERNRNEYPTPSDEETNFELSQTDESIESSRNVPEKLASVGDNEQDIAVSKSASFLKIDKPMISRRSSASIRSQESSFIGDVLPLKDVRIPHDIIYTRCCHLREILPIPAIMKQLKKGSTDPIPLLQLRNPRPSLVEVWCFSDFISSVPVLSVSLDGTSLSSEVFKIILSSLIRKKHFEKLSLRNTSIDDDGWKFLSYFISKSTSLLCIDLTMVPSIKTNVQKPSKSSLKSTLKRMECNLDNRSDRNWDLFSASVAAHGGLEEIIVSGANMSLSQFQNFLSVACQKTERLGLAYNNLTVEQMDYLGTWVINSKITGLDLGFNDLHNKLSGFTEGVSNVIKRKGEKAQFKYFSLNSTNLQVEENASSTTNEPLYLISTLCYCQNLRFLDLSNNPKMFPYCRRTLLNCLPVFVNLVRLHLDFEKLDSTTVIMLAEMFPLCSKLNHLSMLGTSFGVAAVKALTDAVEKSNSLITLDIDYSQFSEKAKEKLSLFTMRNLQNEASRIQLMNTNKSPNSDRLDSLSNLQSELSNILNANSDDRQLYNAMVIKFILRLMHARAKITKVVHDLFELRLNGQLNREGRDALIRLCFIDSCFEKGIRLLKERNPDVNIDSSKAEESNTEIALNLTCPVTEANTSSKVNQKQSGDLQTSSNNSSVLRLSDELNKTGHSMLLPFGKAELVGYFPHAHDTIDLTTDGEIKSLELARQESEEGRLFKQSSHIMREVEDSIANEKIDKNALIGAAESLDSDQIKGFLLKNDISAAVSVIDELHKRGYHLHHIFKKKEAINDDNYKSDCVFNETNDEHPTNNNNNVEDSDQFNIITPCDSEVEVRDLNFSSNNAEEEETIDAEYDKVLDNLQKARIFANSETNR
ncbi:hypothetical protein TPHA_0B02510 [Tetrapisispora phaffii CBS 4417]|uniref:Uncharacterized protein n=1 Tax=Tetrapisispora phaffii (strain ATCC 24235 / CBS 4417 / NBRC 1672 / NRRL Y-8282 / UCD 70-5) TaxID=1071381 RepID=G8BPJ3_TETPH|nr:hypothetical protein TPHA_0B02510 [Tetrapisispora phaffii CBS 4417]CCE61924.1 hypothetical protein TPHA_0B02510 [Tetrapisispora phaffii CBS 4417]